MSARRLAVAGALAAALATGCSRGDIAYPAGWAPLAADRHGCPELAGAWRVQEPASADAGMDLLRDLGLADARLASVQWEVAAIVVDADGAGITLKLAQHARPGSVDAQVLQRHLRTDIARCEGGLATVERRDRDGITTLIRLGKDAQGRLVRQRVERLPGEALARWGDQALLSLGHATRTAWSRWEPVSVAVFDSAAVAAERAAEMPAPARVAAAPPFIAAPPGLKPPALPLPAAPATPPGALPLGEAQAIVLGALPESAVFLGMTPTARGYALRVGGLDTQGITRLARRLAIDGHFRLQDDVPASGASGPASTPEPAAGTERTLELVERRTG